MGQQPQGKRGNLHEVLAAMQRQINNLTFEAQVSRATTEWIAQVAGVTDHVAGIRTQAMKMVADQNNPGQPVPEPAPEAPAETTEQAATPETMDDVRRPGMTPGSVQHLPADTTDVALNPGESLPTSPYNNLVDVEAPVAGTQTHVPDEQTRIETDVRVGDPMNPEIAYPWNISPNQSNGGTTASRVDQDEVPQGSLRTYAALDLARLQIQAGIAEVKDDLVLAQQIEASATSTQEIQSTAATLRSVAAAKPQQAPQNLVPRQASGQRSAPSLAAFQGSGQAAPVAATDTADADLFL